METIAPHFKMTFGAASNPEAVIATDHARFSVLAGRMIRMEYSPSGQFENRASQAFWFRNQPVPQFSFTQKGHELQVDTPAFRLHYITGQPFTAETLWIDIKEMESTWHFGDPDPGNLGGTARTLDEVEGSTPLNLGLISRSGWSLVDDSSSLIFNDQSWLEPRNAPDGQLDLYFLAYGHHYLDALRDFNRISGSVPMIPRWVLGNWWSRYWEYTQEELTRLINDFKTQQIPLSVCIVDMDWHITKTGNKSTGWTGYTWNRKLFPDPQRLLGFLHDNGLKVALNLHPAEGIHPHEESYAQMSEALGLDPAEKAPVEFDISEPRFVDAYFRILHHPMEAQGVDFWWMDWQQGQRSRVAGLDPLWWLNHLHFYDLGRSGSRRSFIFSRWGGLGNHRYPIGFSGDTVVSWASLAFQPYFTATASNVNYGWWSHDIGGHMGGIENAELNARWVQLGVFLPVLRIHATKNPYQDRRPWAYDAESLNVVRDAMQLRHALIPYIYSMAWRYHHENVPLLLPMYYDHPEQEEAYACPNQYMFGSQLLVAPFISPMDADTGLSRTVAWLPQGDWFNYFNGQHYAGDAWHAVYGTLHDIPVFARAGAIVPQSPTTGWGGVETPNHVLLNIFPGADGSFELYDDEGNSNDYLQGSYAITPIVLEWAENKARLTLGPTQGEKSLVPNQRRYDLLFRGFVEPQKVDVVLNGQPVQVSSQFNRDTHTFTIEGVEISPADQVEVTLTSKTGVDLSDRSDTRLFACLKLLKNFRLGSGIKAFLAPSMPDVIADPEKLGRYLPALRESQMRALLEVITGAGVDETNNTGSPLIVVWNNQDHKRVILNTAFQHTHHWWQYRDHFPWSSDAAPNFQAIRPSVDFGSHNPWVVQVNYFGFSTVKLEDPSLEKERD